MKYNPEDMVVSIGGDIIEPITQPEVTGIELDQEECVDTVLTLNGEEYNIKMKRGDLNKIGEKYCGGN